MISWGFEVENKEKYLNSDWKSGFVKIDSNSKLDMHSTAKKTTKKRGDIFEFYF